MRRGRRRGRGAGRCPARRLHQRGLRRDASSRTATTVRADDARAVRHAPTAPAACDNATQSYDPLPSLTGRCRRTRRGAIRNSPAASCVVGVSADSYLLGSRNPLNGQIEGFDIDMAKAVAKAIFGDENKIQLIVITAADRIPVLQDSERRHRRPQHDDDLRPLAGDRLLLRVLPVRAEDPRPEGRPDDQPGRAWPGKKVCAPTGTSSMTSCQSAPESIPVGAATPHRLPRPVPARQGRRHHRRRHRARRARRPGPLRRRPDDAGRSPPSPTASASTRTRRRPRPLRQPRPRRPSRPTGAGRRSTTGGSPDRSGPAPAPPQPVYGRG